VALGVRGNNRLDNLKNLLAESRIALLVQIPGVGETLRLKGRAVISVDPDHLASLKRVANHRVAWSWSRSTACIFNAPGQSFGPRLWDAAATVDRKELPTTGEILAQSGGKIGGVTCDRELPERLKTTLC
jgi:hypothetical protein